MEENKNRTKFHRHSPVITLLKNDIIPNNGCRAEEMTRDTP